MSDAPVRETEIEGPASEYAETRGWFAIKIMRASRRGFPDHFFARNGLVILIEFKRPGEPATTQQKKRHKELRAQKVPVFVVDNLDEAKRILQ